MTSEEKLTPDQGWWPAVIETPSDGPKTAPRAIEKKPKPLHEYRVPDRVTADWARKQLTKAEWAAIGRTRCNINPNSIEVMATDIRRGIPAKYVMAKMSLGMSTWYEWEKRAANGDQPYLLWYQAIQASKGEVVGKVLDSVMEQALAGDLKSAQMILKTVDRDEFSDKPSTSVTINGGVGNSTSVNHMSDEKVVDLAQILVSLGIKNLDPPVHDDIIDAEEVEEGDDD
jgi:hypothetical protein